jgi:Gpi18-like mannosyltransferase
MFSKIASSSAPSEVSTSNTELTQEGMDGHRNEYNDNSLSWKKWLDATKNIFPTFVAIHAGAFVISCLAILFTIRDFSLKKIPINTLWWEWNRWDTQHFTYIANNGYTYMRTAFFPLFPLLMRIGKIFTHNNALVSGLLVSNLADLLVMVVFYQLVYEEFGQQQARRAVLYISVFPTAFFFLASYNEALFLCLALICTYFSRHNRWWLAGIFGFLAMMTRSVAILLTLPLLYEYLRQRQFHIRNIRFNIVSIGLIPLALVIYSCYCYYRFGDFLSYAKGQQIFWNRYLEFPGYNLWIALKTLIHSPSILSFNAQRTFTDALPDLFIFALLILALVGPWRFKRSQMMYAIYGWLTFIYAQMYPVLRPYDNPTFPLEALSRYLLEVFPAIMILAVMGKHRIIDQCYLMISGATFFFLLTQFLTGHWVI